MGRIVNAFLELAEERAIRKIPMTMEDWSIRLDKFLEFNESEILTHTWSISHKEAKKIVESQREKYRVTQDRLFESDFDREIQNLDISSDVDNHLEEDKS